MPTAFAVLEVVGCGERRDPDVVRAALLKLAAGTRTSVGSPRQLDLDRLARFAATRK